MKKFSKNTRKIVGISAVLIASIAIGSVVTLFASPGSEDDPIITLSYIQREILPKLNATSPKSGFEVINMEKGDVLTLDKSSEAILRMGNAKVIASEKGGLANVTAGEDLSNGADVPPNSLLICPLADGRGVVASDKVILMVSGGYELK